MRHALCTISYRHQLTSFGELVRLASRLGLDGIELWGVHAGQLYEQERRQTEEGLRRLLGAGAEISMISDYIDLSPGADRDAARDRCLRQLERARWFGAGRIRCFAGHRASRDLSDGEREAIVEQAVALGRLCLEAGVQLLLETHPGTLLDRLDVTARAMEQAEQACPGAVGLNLDVLHLWETGTSPLVGWQRLRRWTGSLHLKNIDRLEHVSVFAPAQVYDASGSREGMRGLGEGAIDYRPLLTELSGQPIFGSIEWFGADPTDRLARDLVWLREQERVALAVGID
ncbi:hypothetical protein PA598K_02022 [Paenibacillus sp. 598K]|uniref:sugar phosphate isomerase/epimerase family protein n=1 Tax=Paenibacillus sp. 598K TaxID=1117987 RepID=UPI000FFADB45|nr:sugar phosphate isomerase/epimerase family protein [Paenibacillus sp. 598K]GBF73708.1 hypothetical protein PA598K_02022 [Paenibacillus sp. 598K]